MKQKNNNTTANSTLGQKKVDKKVDVMEEKPSKKLAVAKNETQTANQTNTTSLAKVDKKQVQTPTPAAQPNHTSSAQNSSAQVNQTKKSPEPVPAPKIEQKEQKAAPEQEEAPQEPVKSLAE